MVWTKFENPEPADGELCGKLEKIIPHYFTDGFSTKELMDHSELTDEDREIIRWHSVNGAKTYGFGAIYCRRRGDCWEVVDRRSQRALWFGSILRELGLALDEPIMLDDPALLRELHKADLNARSEVGPPDYPAEEGRRISEPDTQEVYYGAARHLKIVYGKLTPMTRKIVREALKAIDFARRKVMTRTATGDAGPRLPLCRAAFEGDEDEVRILLASGTKVDEYDEEAELRALDFAALYGHEAIVRLLVEAGADIHAVGPDGVTALHSAAEGGDQEIVHFILSLGADVNARSMSGTSTLHTAAFGAGAAVVELLLQRGASLNAVDDQYSTPLDVAVQFKNQEVISLLIRHGGRFGMDLEVVQWRT